MTDVDRAATELIATLDALMIQAEPWHNWNHIYKTAPQHDYEGRLKQCPCRACETKPE